MAGRGRPKGSSKKSTSTAIQDSVEIEESDEALKIQDPEIDKILEDFTGTQFIKSGSTLLDQILGGGWALGRLALVEGMPSTGKTQLAIEACANFHRQYPKGSLWYHDSEAAFDEAYAHKLGLPRNKVQFTKERAVSIEEFFGLFEDALDRMPKDSQGIFVLDSLDALESNAQIAGDISDPKFKGAQRAGVIGQGLKKTIPKMRLKNCHAMFIQQLRAMIGTVPGLKASNGNAPPFYASQIVRIKQLKHIDQTIENITRTVGVAINAKSKKCKIGLPYRECNFNILFNYGLDDILSCLAWLAESNRLSYLGNLAVSSVDKKTGEVLYYQQLWRLMEKLFKLEPEEYDEACVMIQRETAKAWQDIEVLFDPGRSKYS